MKVLNATMKDQLVTTEDHPEVKMAVGEVNSIKDVLRRSEELINDCKTIFAQTDAKLVILMDRKQGAEKMMVVVNRDLARYTMNAMNMMRVYSYAV